MNKKGKILALLVVVLLASCANAPQGDNTPQYEKQVVEPPGVSNVRQLGGYIIGDKKVRMDLLLRSGSLSNASDDAIATLHDKYKLALATYFRSSAERNLKTNFLKTDKCYGAETSKTD